MFPHEYRRALREMVEEAAEQERLKKEQELMKVGSRLSITEVHLEKMESLDNMYDEDIINDLGEDGKEVREREKWKWEKEIFVCVCLCGVGASG